MLNHLYCAARRSITSVAIASVVTLAALASTGFSPVWAQKPPPDKAQTDKATADKAAADKVAAKPAPSNAAKTATMPSPLDPVQVGDLSPVPAPAIAAKAWITVDVTSGQVVASSNPDMKIEPASLTKIMTAYVAFTALKEKRIALDQQANVSQVAWKTRGSRMFIEPRKPVTVDELIKGVIIQSGNDASVALAEAVSGSESAFVSVMNEEARRMGMTNTVYVNTTGLPDPQHVTTVRDLATIARRMITDHPDYFPYYAMREFTYNKIKQSNRNRLLWADPSVDGMKTGHTDAAGYCLVATAKRGDRRVITVIVGSDSMATRAEESLKLLNWTFQNFETVKLFDQTHAAVEAQVWQGKVDSTKLGVSEPLWVTVPRGKAAEVKPIAKRPDPLFAPLAKDERVGTLTLMLDGKMLMTRPLLVLNPVERAGFVGRTVDSVRLWFRKKPE